MRRIDYGDVEKILRNKKIAAGIFGAGVGASGGYLLGDKTDWADPGLSTIGGALAGGLLGYKLPRSPYNRSVIDRNVSKIDSFSELLGGAKLNGGFVPYDGYWIAPSIGGALLGYSGTATVTDNPYLQGLGGVTGLLAGRALDYHMLKNTKFPTYK